MTPSKYQYYSSKCFNALMDGKKSTIFEVHFGDTFYREPSSTISRYFLYLTSEPLVIINKDGKFTDYNTIIFENEIDYSLLYSTLNDLTNENIIPKYKMYNRKSRVFIRWNEGSKIWIENIQPWDSVGSQGLGISKYSLVIKHFKERQDKLISFKMFCADQT